MSKKDVCEENNDILNIDDFTKGDLFHRNLIGKRVRRMKKHKG